MKLNIVILAAGKGSRMKSNVPKVLMEVGGAPMVIHSFAAAKSVNPDKIICVTAKDNSEVREIVSKSYKDTIHVIQEAQDGTGDAVKYAVPHISDDAVVIVLFADNPLITKKTLDDLYNSFQNNENQAVVVVAYNKYEQNQNGKLIIENGRVVSIVENSEATAEEKQIPTCNSGMMGINGKYIASLLAQIKNDNYKNEYYLTDIVKIANQESLDVGYIVKEESELAGANTLEEIADIERLYQGKKFDELTENGVKFHDPKTVSLSYDTSIGYNTQIGSAIIFGKNVTIGRNIIVTNSNENNLCFIENISISDGSLVSCSGINLSISAIQEEL